MKRIELIERRTCDRMYAGDLAAWLREAGFDMSRPVKKEYDVRSDYYVFVQDVPDGD